MINIIGIGGAGSSVVSDITQQLKETLVGHPIKTYILYSSVDTVDSEFTPDVAFRFKTSDTAGTDLKGSGGDRRVNAKHLMSGTIDFLDAQLSKPFHKAKKGEAVNIIIHSGSKGTGSIAGPMLSKLFLEAGIPSVSMLIIDDADEVTIVNNLNTISTYASIAESTKTNPLISFHLNGLDGKTEAEVNQDILKDITVLSLMGIGLVNGLDETDYLTFIDVTRYKTYKFDYGVMCLYRTKVDEYAEPIPIPKELTPVVARVIDTNKTKTQTGIKARHSPHGYITGRFEDIIPTTMVSCTGFDLYVNALRSKFKEKKVEVNMTRLDTDPTHDLIEDDYFKPMDTTEDEGWVAGFVL